MSYYKLIRKYIQTEECIVEAESTSQAREYAENDDENVFTIHDYQGEYEVSGQITNSSTITENEIHQYMKYKDLIK